MSTIPKEIIKKLWEICEESDGFDIATKAYQLALSSPSLRWELLENVREDRNRYREAFESQIVEIAQQDSDISALTEKLKEESDENIRLQCENNHIMKLLRKFFDVEYESDQLDAAIAWEQFKTENNLSHIK